MPSWDGSGLGSAAEAEQPEQADAVLTTLGAHLLDAAKAQLELGTRRKWADVRAWMRAKPFAAPDQGRAGCGGVASDAGLE